MRYAWGLGVILAQCFYAVLAGSPVLWLAGASLVTWVRPAPPLSAEEAARASGPVPAPVRRLAIATLGVLAAGTLTGAGVVVTEAQPGLVHPDGQLVLLAACMLLFVAVFALYAVGVGTYVHALRSVSARRSGWMTAWAWLVPPSAVCITAALFVAALRFGALALGTD